MPGAHKHSIKEINDKKIKRLAIKYAAKVPEKVFSPAELLSFLLERKKSPARAISEVEDWIALEAAREIKEENAIGQDQGKTPLPTTAADNPESAAWPRGRPSTTPVSIIGPPTPPLDADELEKQLAKATNEEDALGLFGTPEVIFEPDPSGIPARPFTKGRLIEAVLERRSTTAACEPRFKKVLEIWDKKTSKYKVAESIEPDEPEVDNFSGYVPRQQ